jgi:hypothetical protein
LAMISTGTARLHRAAVFHTFGRASSGIAIGLVVQVVHPHCTRREAGHAFTNRVRWS